MQAFSCSFSWSNKTSHITTGASEGRDGLKSWILAIIYPFGNLGIFLNSGRIYTYDIRSWFLNQTHLKCGYTLNQVKGCRVLGPRWSDYLLCNNAKSLLLTTIILFCSQFRGTRIRELFGWAILAWGLSCWCHPRDSITCLSIVGCQLEARHRLSAAMLIILVPSAWQA